MVVLAHNHPDGLACPSHNDIGVTANLISTFKSIDVNIIEHFIIAGSNYYPLVYNTQSLQIRSGEENEIFSIDSGLKF